MRLSACFVKLLAAVWLLVVALPIMASAYDLDTHEQLSRSAFDTSGMASTLQSVYGILPVDTFRGRLPFFIWERHTPADWIAEGGRDEDSPLWRVLNHFYDPYHDEPLTVLGSMLGERAPDWALEDRGDFFSQNHSYKDARAAFYLGLTASNSTTRERELGHTFYALGHVIHLIQDMAQAQHTRNDQHFFIGPSSSLMETYVEGLSGFVGGLDARFPLFGASVPAVMRVRDLWVTGTGTQMTGFGMSEFSNINFVSAGTNFTELRTGATAERFPRPILNLNDSSTSSPADACKDGAQAPGPLTFYANSFTDPVTGRDLRNERMTTYSIFDQYLVARGRQPIFALNCFNLDTAADTLLPRAVSYSAALLQYFFRGQFSADPVSAGGSAQLAFDLRHLTPGEDFAGTAAIYYDTTAGQRVPVTGLAPSSLTFTAPAPVVRVSFDRPSDNPSDAYVIVLMGRLGQEDVTPGNPAGAILARVTRSARQTTPVATSAALATAPDGSLLLVWQQLDSAGRRLLYNRLTPEGTDLVAPLPVFAFGASFLHPPVTLAVGPDGQAHLAFTQAFSTGATRIRYVRVGLDGGVVASTIAAGTVESAVGSASLAVDPRTGLPSVVYFERQDLDTGTPLRIRAVHLDATGTQLGARDFLLRFGAGAGANDFDAGTAVTIDEAGALAAVWLAKIGGAGDTGYNLYVPGSSPGNPIRLTEGALRNQVLFDLFHTPVQRAAPDGTLHLAWGHTLGGRPAVFYGTRPLGGLAFTVAAEVPATPSSDSRRPQFVLPTPTRTVLTWTRDATDVALAEFDPSQPGLPTTRAATNISTTAALSTDSAVTLTVDSTTGAERRVLTYTDASDGSNNVYLQFYTPLILDVSPNPARSGQAVTVTGEGFGAAPLTEGRVTLNGSPLGLGSWSDTAITVTLPAGATSGPLVVEAQGASDAVILEVLP